MDIEVLRSTGLNEREAKLYLALLDLGSSTIGPLMEKTDIPSSKIYEILHRLEEKGLANHIIIKKQKKYQASDPEIILQQMELKQEKFKEYLKNLKEQQKLAQEKQYAEFYEGREAIFSIWRSIVKLANPGDEYYSFSLDEEHADPIIAAFVSNLTLLRQEKKLKIKVISNESNRKLLKKVYTKKELKIVNHRFTDIDYPDGIVIINDEILMMEWEGTPSAIKIKSRTFADSYKRFFNEVYNKGKK